MRQREDKEAALREVVALLYEAAVDPQEWIGALDRTYQLFDSMAAHFFVWDQALDQPVESRGSATYEGREAVLGYYLRIDPRRVLLVRQPIGSTLLCHEHFDDAFVRRNEFYQDYSLPLGRRYLMATNLLQSGPTTSILAVLRSPRQGPFGSDDQVILERLRPHLRRVARVHGRLEQQRRESELGRDLLDGVQTCLIAADAAARVVRMNQAAQTMLRAGNALRIASGRLVAWTHAQTDLLHRLIRSATVTQAGEETNGGSMIVDGRSESRHGLMVMPLSRHSTILGKPEVPLALLTMNSLEQPPGNDRDLIEMFGLTPAEARLATEIAAGKRLDNLAQEHGVRMPTLRTQIRAIYGKTGTSRQAELAHLVSSLPRLRLDQ
jgi:DNA-binding CsgD family transcriptional regulator